MANKDYSQLKLRGVSYFITSEYSKSLSGQLSVDLKLFNVRTERQIESANVIMTKANLREKGHEAMDIFYQKITGKTSIFRSKVVFVSDRDSRPGKDIKELYIMDFDGFNKKRITRHEGTVISPAFSFDGKKVLYSLIKNSNSKHRNVNLYIMDIETRKSRILSKKKGINSGAVFMPDGKHIALTMSHQGNAEIYALNVNSGKTRS